MLKSLILTFCFFNLATTRRVRHDPNAAQSGQGGPPAPDRNTRRKQSTSTGRRHHSSIRRGSHFHEVHIAMLPDLSGNLLEETIYNYQFIILRFHTCCFAENLTDEERIWEEIHEIKTMPVSMAQKRDMKAQLQNATKLRLQGFKQIKWQRRKVCQQFHAKWSEYLMKMALWRNPLKTIEGNCGTGVVAYFLFLRWLILLNLSIFILILIFIVMPQTLLNANERPNCNELLDQNSTECCYHEYLNQTTCKSIILLDLVQGTDFLEKTIMFYGMYSNKIFGYPNIAGISSSSMSSIILNNNNNNFSGIYSFSSNSLNNNNYTGSSSNSIDRMDVEESSSVSNSLTATNETSTTVSYILQMSGYQFYYDLPMAYVSVNVVFLLMSLVAIVKSVSREFKDRMVEGEGQFYQYCNLIFGGWDFCIHNEKSAHIKHKALLNEMKGLIQSKRMEFERHNRSKDVMFKLVLIRLIVNLIVCIILLAAACIIFISFNYSQEKQQINKQSKVVCDTPGQITPKMLNSLFIEFLPYITIVCMNFLVPLLFNYLVQFEQYSPMFIIKITLLRTVFLRLSSLGVLLSRFYFFIQTDDDLPTCRTELGRLQCWETYVGQQFYKLLVVDFVTHVFVTFFINFPRAWLARHCNTKFTRFIGEQEFELSKHVLDIIYSQTICWLGTFYSPFIPATAVVLHFFMFYIKKFACLTNSKPSAILYRASRSNSLFMLVLLLSYALALIPIVYAAAEILPSRACGPFRGLPSVWAAAITAFQKLPIFCQKIIFFFGTATFAVPCFIGLILCLYYYYAVSVANKHMVEMLKNQLVLEGHDKQFLLNRLSAFLKQQQDYQKKMRQMEYHSSIPPPLPPQPSSRTTSIQKESADKPPTPPPSVLSKKPPIPTPKN